MVPEPARAERPSLVPLRGRTGAALVAATVFAPPAPYHGCALPDVDFADRPLTTTAGGAGAPGRTSEPTVSG
jgi:hypothetical protein